MRIGIISLFPEIFNALDYGIVGQAQKNKLLNIEMWNPRDFTRDKRQTVDDRPYGGGPGMVMMAEPLRGAIKSAKQTLGDDTKVVYLSPQGKRFEQRHGQDFIAQEKVLLLCGRYEGVDERLIESDVDEEWSIGDYVLSGGEFAALVMVDAITRLIPGALGDEASAVEDSFVAGLLDYPHYTRPEVEHGLAVPKVLTSGDHQAIRRWRWQQALGRTWLRRPDLLAERTLTAKEQTLLDEFIAALKQDNEE
ncbi:MAG: tRNA (guanosine(37)-N1)-methyltransferase TrmD [Legionellales bacterium]|nr:tRNA (guanosine(37)-N1)-methyltransferase TrmD [Legionellales bacterium]|tara:strand:- start:2362 stop:3111 length:750 start_codon:yes stop_codon:yes gene_type:complete